MSFCPAPVIAQLLQHHREDEGARVVVGGIALASIRDGKDRMLQHSRVIGQRIQMIEFQFRQLIQSSLGVARAEN